MSERKHLRPSAVPVAFAAVTPAHDHVGIMRCCFQWQKSLCPVEVNKLVPVLGVMMNDHQKGRAPKEMQMGHDTTTRYNYLYEEDM